MGRRIIGYTTVRNEADRYLEHFLAYYVDFFDDWYVLDDQSTDSSLEMLRSFVEPEVRPQSVPSFLEHEGAFRQYAWERMTEKFKPNKNDWVMMVDADEFLWRKSDARDLIDNISPAYDGVRLHIPDIHKVDGGGRLFRRTDGVWDNNYQSRFVKFRPAGFKRKHLKAACGSPEYETNWLKNQDIKLYHIGYIRDRDKDSKYERYSSRGYFGHRSSHIESIIEEPEGFWVEGVSLDDFLT